MSPDPVAALLERLIGLDAASLGPSALPAAVAERQRALGLPDPAAYAGQLAQSPAEQAELIDRLIVPETWFFRGGTGLFAHLAREAAARTADGGRVFRALSFPCSTGEEPYSLAIGLTEAGLPPGRWAVEGIDLSPRLLAAAEGGVYREFSLRQTDPGRRARYFRHVDKGWALDDAVRSRVRYRVGNLLDPKLSAEAYDLILCRNVLIYLTPAARRTALETLERLLVPDGWLGVGHAEGPSVAGRGFQREGPEGLFLFRRGSSAQRGEGGPLAPLSPQCRGEGGKDASRPRTAASPHPPRPPRRCPRAGRRRPPHRRPGRLPISPRRGRAVRRRLRPAWRHPPGAWRHRRGR
jgi:chemotaxis protein methyltransferase WspC